MAPIIAPHLFVFRSVVTAAEETQDWTTVVDYYAVVFESFTNMNLAFKVISHCCSDSLFINGTYYAPARRVGGIKRCFCPSVCPSVCLSRT